MMVENEEQLSGLVPPKGSSCPYRAHKLKKIPLIYGHKLDPHYNTVDNT